MKSQRATLLRVQLVDIHGQKFYDLTFALDSKPDAPKTSRIGTESVYPDPKEGDAIEVALLLGQLTSVKRAA
jgi:hypothetical protein